MKKVLSVLVILAFFLVLNTTDLNIRAFNYNETEYDMFITSDLQNLVHEIKSLENTRQIGKYYKVGMMGHRRVVELGELIELRYERLTQGTEYQIGIIGGMKVEEIDVYESSKTVTTSFSIASGFTQIMSAALSFGDVASVGTSSTKTTAVDFEYETVYAERELSSKKVEIEYDFTKVCPNQTTVAVGEVVLIARFNVLNSYTEEQNLFGKWKMLSSTKLGNYDIDYHFNTVTSFIYQKGTGTKDIGYFPFGKIELQ